MKWLIPILALVLVSCTKTLYVPVEKVKTEYVDRLQQDSIFVRDSIYVHEKGDTIYINKDRYVYRDKLVRDSIFIRDSIPYPVHVETVKEVKYIPKVYKWSFIIVMAVAGAFIISSFKPKWLSWLLSLFKKLFK